MLNIPLVVTPFLVALCVTACLVAERWLRLQGARAARVAVIAITSVACVWGALVIADGAHTAYMAMPPDLPARAAR
jgi:hypothetical protein